MKHIFSKSKAETTWRFYQDDDFSIRNSIQVVDAGLGLFDKLMLRVVVEDLLLMQIRDSVELSERVLLELHVGAAGTKEAYSQKHEGRAHDLFLEQFHECVIFHPAWQSQPKEEE